MNDSSFASRSASLSIGTRWLRWAVPLAVVVLGGVVGFWYWMTHGTPVTAAEADQSGGDRNTQRSSAVSVEVVHPRDGGIERVCVQPGSIEPMNPLISTPKYRGF